MLENNNDCKHSDYKLCFKLKQHTPIIHFQADQKGATLRASELKPKLDRFLIDKLGKGNYEDFLIAGQDKALDYKVSIVSTEKVIKMPNKYLFFANSLLDKKINSVISNNIDISIVTYNTELIKTIDENLDYFFASHNFGMRQNKGYGSFYREKFKVDFLTALKNTHSAVYKTKKSFSFENVVNEINKILKSGNNYNIYSKSVLFTFSCQKVNNIRWEKRKIKQEFPSVLRPYYKSPKDCKLIDEKYFRYVRAVLGVTDSFEYNQGPKRGGERISVSHPLVKRFKSPLLFKVYNHNVYLVFDDSYKRLLKQKDKYKFELDGTNSEFSLNTFKENEFDMEEFLDFATVQKESKDLIEKVQL